jgi:hypothetical protein
VLQHVRAVQFLSLLLMVSSRRRLFLATAALSLSKD